MKVLFLLIAIVFPVGMNAQIFSFQEDTVVQTVSTFGNVQSDILNVSDSPVVIKWQVIASDFPADWSGANNLGICDNYLCYSNMNNTLLNGTMHQSMPYMPGVEGDFHLQLSLGASSPGTHYIIVKFDLDTIQSTEIFFLISHWHTGISALTGVSSLLLYPNPAVDELIIQFDSDVSNVLLINGYGQILSQFKDCDNERIIQVNLKSFSSGVYCAVGLGKEGQIITIRKFEKK